MVHVYPKSGFFLNAETGQGVWLNGMADIMLPYDLQVIGVLAFIAFAVAAVVSNLMIVFFLAIPQILNTTSQSSHPFSWLPINGRSTRTNFD